MSKTRLLNLLKRRIGIRWHRSPRSKSLDLLRVWGSRQFGKQQITQIARLGQPMVVMHTR